MGAKFFSHRTPGGTRAAGGQCTPEQGLEGRDHQQALVLSVLRRAAGAPVSYAELREAGVELPASVVSELELAGVAIERCSSDRRRAIGVRLDPADDRAARPAPVRVPVPVETPMPTATENESGWSSVRIYRREGPLGGLRTSRGLAVMALLTGIVVASAFVAMWGAGAHRATRAPIARRSHPRLVAGAGASHPVKRPRSRHQAPAVPVSPGLARQLEARGHSLLEAGRYDAAVPVLKRAVMATGETLTACIDPSGATCLTYAYALYDLGRATRLSGQPQAAVPILERRLKIDNQRSTVVAQLQLAREGIG